MGLLSKRIAAIVCCTLFLGAVVVFISLPGIPGSQSTSEWDETAAQILNRSHGGGLTSPVPAGQPRRSAVYSGLMIAGVLGLLYAYRRRPYILYSMCAWILLSFGLYIVSRGYAEQEHASAAAVTLMLTKVGGALLFFRCAHNFSGSKPYTTRLWILVPALVAWFVLGAERFSVPLTLAPPYLLTGAIYTRSAIVFGQGFRKRRMLGALLLAFPFVVIGATNLGFGIFFAPVMRSAELLLLFLTWNSVSFLVAAFGMCFLVFEEVAHELQDRNRELQQAQHELKRLATVDALTGCYNRHFFEANIRRELQRRRRYGTPLSILFIDIDRFKAINDSLGHDVGDRVLQYFGDLLKRQFRQADYVVRWGGDEFLVLLTCTGAEAASKAALLKETLDNAVNSTALPPGLSLSVGYAEVPPDSPDILPFIRIADQNMYADKSRGSR